MKFKIGKKSGLKYFSYQDIQDFKPCYDPVKYIPTTWRGTAIDILNLKDVLDSDRLWVVLHAEIISDRVMRLFAVWCARQVQHLMTDPRSISALDVAERFSNGLATKVELAAAWSAARSDARDAAWGAARAAARSDARDAARYAAWGAAWSDARDADQDAQISKLKEMVMAEGKERISNRKLRG